MCCFVSQTENGLESASNWPRKKMNERKRNCSSYTQPKSHWNFKGNGWIEKYWRKKPLRYIASRLNHSFRNVNLWHCNYYFLAVYVFVVAMHSHNSFGYDRSRIQYSRRYTKTQTPKQILDSVSSYKNHFSCIPM